MWITMINTKRRGSQQRISQKMLSLVINSAAAMLTDNRPREEDTFRTNMKLNSKKRGGTLGKFIYL